MSGGRPEGRPRTIETPAEFDRLVEEYRVGCKAEKDPVTFAGMARHLGFMSRQSFYDYEKQPAFSYSVKRARLLVEEEYEKRLSGMAATGAIFALKNHGWSDKQELEHAGRIEVGVDEARERLHSRIAGLSARIGTNGAHPATNGNGAHGP